MNIIRISKVEQETSHGSNPHIFVAYVFDGQVVRRVEIIDHVTTIKFRLENRNHSNYIEKETVL